MNHLIGLRLRLRLDLQPPPPAWTHCSAEHRALTCSTKHQSPPSLLPRHGCVSLFLSSTHTDIWGLTGLVHKTSRELLAHSSSLPPFSRSSDPRQCQARNLVRCIDIGSRLLSRSHANVVSLQSPGQAGFLVQSDHKSSSWPGALIQRNGKLLRKGIAAQFMYVGRPSGPLFNPLVLL